MMPDMVFYILWLAILVATPQPTEALFIYDLTQPAISMPREMAEGAFNVITCESKWNTSAVGAEGEMGLIQVHPIHRRSMVREGLDYRSERDRLNFAVSLWRVSGWNPWSCSPNYPVSQALVLSLRWPTLTLMQGDQP